MKYILSTFLISIISFTLSAQQNLDKVVAVVGGEILLQSEVDETYNYLLSQNPSLPEDAKCRITDQLLLQKMMVNQAKLDSLQLSDEEVESQLNQRFDDILNMMNNDPKQFEEYYGKTINEAREQMRDDMRNQMLAQRMQSDIVSKVEVTPSEVKKFFQQIPKDSLPYFNSEVELGEIIYYPKVNEGEKQRAYNKIADLLKKIQEGATTFEEAATRYSDDKGSARLGGDLGWQKRGQFVAPFEGAAYRLEKNEISPITETEFGYHIIQLIERRGNRIHARHILIKPDITAADELRAQHILDSIRLRIVSDSLHFETAVKKFSSDKAMSYNNGGLMINNKTGNSFFEIGDLDPDIYFAIDTMKVGGVTKPIAFQNETGGQYFRLVKLKSRTEPHKANLLEDYSKIKNAAVEEKKSSELVKWVERTSQKTFVRLDSTLQGCELLQKWQKSPKP